MSSNYLADLTLVAQLLRARNVWLGRRPHYNRFKTFLRQKQKNGFGKVKTYRTLNQITSISRLPRNYS